MIYFVFKAALCFGFMAFDPAHTPFYAKLGLASLAVTPLVAWLESMKESA